MLELLHTGIVPQAVVARDIVDNPDVGVPPVILGGAKPSPSPHLDMSPQISPVVQPAMQPSPSLSPSPHPLVGSTTPRLAVSPGESPRSGSDGGVGGGAVSMPVMIILHLSKVQ